MGTTTGIVSADGSWTGIVGMLINQVIRLLSSVNEKRGSLFCGLTSVEFTLGTRHWVPLQLDEHLR